MRDHHKLRAFELADNLVLAVYAATKFFPKEELFGLSAQLRRSAVSVASNIVEGSARSSHSEYVRFLEVAYGSAQETRYQLSVAARLGYLRPEITPELTAQADELVRVLAGLVRSLRSAP